jgi:hypothetical protein
MHGCPACVCIMCLEGRGEKKEKERKMCIVCGCVHYLARQRTHLASIRPWDALTESGCSQPDTLKSAASSIRRYTASQHPCI